jgi:hypothetical protein
MHDRFDIFCGPQTDPTWLEAADGLNHAVARMEQKARANPGHYFVYDTDRQSVVASIDTNRSAFVQMRTICLTERAREMRQRNAAEQPEVTKCMNPEKDCPNTPDEDSLYVVFWQGKPLTMCSRCGREFQRRKLLGQGHGHFS